MFKFKHRNVKIFRKILQLKFITYNIKFLINFSTMIFPILATKTSLKLLYRFKIPTISDDW
jgi:hypothetical protein